ncbi:hypothetical protein SDC9_167824 [bioreactor metagenome]|uniref:Uncharacterized protein n=1 Tax=bioreactor metagenome TaxID=1076179 RepID=A0A645G1C3_9ZZZZ
MLTDVGDNDRILTGHVADHLHNVARAKRFFPELWLGVLPTPFGKLPAPLGVILFVNEGQQLGEHLTDITRNKMIDHNVLVHLGTVDVDMNNLSAGGKLRRICCHTVGKSGPDYNQNIRVTHGKRARNIAMHADHTHIQRIIVRQHASAHDRMASGQRCFVDQLIELI